MLTDCAAWDRLLGLPLQKALDIAHAWGCDPQVLVTRAPKRKGDDADAPENGTLRVIRACDGVLTVGVFPDGMPKEK